jgi:SAM-dependent methyltransferase
MSESSATRKNKAVELAARFVPAGGRILEVSCGSGSVLMQLRERGYRIRGTNFSRYEETLESDAIDHGVDLLAGLPYEDGSFDGIILLDVIEHLRDHDRAVAELARVCRQGGHVIVMTPNTLKLTSRLHYFLSGFHKLKRAFIGFDVPRERAFAFHNFPPHLPTFLYQLRSYGLNLVHFTASVYKAKSFVLYGLLFPFIWCATSLTLHRGEKHLRGTPAAAELQRVLTSVAGLCGEFWFVVAQKRAATAPQVTPVPTWSTPWHEGPGQGPAGDRPQEA